MPKAQDQHHFVPDSNIPTARLQTTLRAGYAAMARCGSSGLILFDDERPSYLVTDDFIYASLLSQAGELANGLAVEAAGLLPIVQFVHKWLTDPEFDRRLQEIIPGENRPMVLRVSPHNVSVNEEIPEALELPPRYGVYRVDIPLRSGWHVREAMLAQGLFTGPAQFRCRNGHKNDDFGNGMCIVRDCNTPLITRP